MPNLTINRPSQITKQRYFEPLGGEQSLEMVKIEGGSFLMGSDPSEDGHERREDPVHDVNISTFCMGRYPITQAQWQQVASYPQVKIELNPDPSSNNGNPNHPVEKVNWHEAVEFCARLSHRSSRTYRLPSEAEWEYACRAGTPTPFHFGETLSDQLANYRATEVYGRGQPGKYRESTVSVFDLNAPNDFGLCHMHGNVWEWCQDVWHSNYDDAPTDGSAWLEGGDDTVRVLRGGSWKHIPEFCRSAYRNFNFPAYRDYLIGFRVVSVSRGTPS